MEADRPHVHGLTPREQEVLDLIAEGMTSREIASALHIGYGTVRTHLEQVYNKLGVSTHTQAAVWVWRKRVANEHRNFAG